MTACPGCGLASYDGLCPHCRGDQDAYERELVPPFPSSLADPCEACDPTGHCPHGCEDADEFCGWCDYGIGPCTCAPAAPRGAS